MIPAYNKIHNKFKLNGVHYSFEALKEVVYSLVKEGAPFEKEIGHFLLAWQDKSPFIEVKTSGSTGVPKTIQVSKQAMVNSAIATGDFFKLKPGDTALLCLPASYIAGKMMLIRAFVLGLELEVIAPKGCLEIDTSKPYDFSAMVPLQVKENLNKLERIKSLIVGGASVSNDLLESIKPLRTNFYETYGMTETVSHIAVKKLNNFNSEKTTLAYFQVLPQVAISQDNRDCLVIEAPQVSDSKIITNDIVKQHSKTTFEWIGRYDNIINSGGIKYAPEQIENKLSNKINTRFFIASETHDTLGEAIILILEAQNNQLDDSVFSVLDTYERPKAIYAVDHFIETTSGKIQRKKTLALLKK